jgi:DNA polymerase III alpha subunit
MKYDLYGQSYTDCQDLFDLLYKNPSLSIEQFSVIDPDRYNSSIRQLHAELEQLTPYSKSEESIDEFDFRMQSNWHMPDEYKQLDITAWILDQCREQHELQRVGQELLLYQERNLFDLLRYLKYLVDTLRKNNVIWGVGRGSSVASYVLYLIGVHRINSIYYDLSIEEFLK